MIPFNYGYGSDKVNRYGSGSATLLVSLIITAGINKAAFLCDIRILVRGASKIKLKKVNKKRMVTVRRVIIFLNISRHPLLICLKCFLHQYKTLKAVATATAAIALLTPAKNLKKVFLGFLVVSPCLVIF